MLSDQLDQLVLPVKLHFSCSYAGMRVEIRKPGSAQTIAMSGARFGSGAGVDPNPVIGTYTIVFEADATVNPGDVQLGRADVTLYLHGKEYPMTFRTAQAPQPLIAYPQGSAPAQVLSGQYMTGYVYYDAMALADNHDPSVTVEILNAYGVDLTNLHHNKFLFDEYSNVVRGAHVQGLAGSLGSTLASLDVTAQMAPIARFLANRAKDELTEAFFRRMKDQLNATPELRTAFPSSAKLLANIETYSYSAVIQVLKEAFESDVEHLADNVYQIKGLTRTDCIGIEGDMLATCQDRMDKLKNFFTTTREGAWTGFGLLLAKEAIGASNPANALSTIATSTELMNVKNMANSNGEYNLTSCIELADLFSKSFLSRNSDALWINGDEFNALMSNERRIKTYLGLLLAMEQRGDPAVSFKMSDGTSITFGKMLTKLHGEYASKREAAVQLIRNVHQLINTGNQAVKRILAASDRAQAADAQALYDYYRTISGSMQAIAGSELIEHYTNVGPASDHAAISQVVDRAADLAYHVATQRYSAAIHDATLLIESIKPDVIETSVSKSFLKYGTMIGSVATAKTPEEVEQALEASVLPVGSSSIKRFSQFSISLNAYVGFYYGKATTNGTDMERSAITNQLTTVTKDQKVTSYGLFAPIGVSFSWGSKIGLGGSITPQLFDLGALVNFYLVNGDTTALPNDFTIRLSNIVAPGLQLGINIPRTPLTLLLGGQYVPALYAVDQISSSNEILATNAWRYHVGLAVDIPMLNLLVKDFKK